MSKIKILLLLTTIIILSFCSAQQKIEDILKTSRNEYICTSPDGDSYEPEGKGWTVITDIVFDDMIPLYGDLYLPLPYGQKDNTIPAVLHIHGGGWVSGSRRLSNAVWWGQYLACRGYAFFDIEYRLFPEVMINQQIEDVKCALVWLKTVGKKLGIASDKIAVMGGSAGGHLAAMVATTQNEKDFNPKCSLFKEYGASQELLSVKASIPFYGVFDLTKFTSEMASTFGLEDIYERIRGITDKISPINYAKNPKNTSFLIVHGDADWLAPLPESVNFYNSLKSYNIDAELVIVKGANHAFDAIPNSEFTKTTAQKVYDFLKKTFGKGKTENINLPQTYQEHITKGIYYLEQGSFKSSQIEFKKALENSQTCESHWGYALSIMFDIYQGIIPSLVSVVLEPVTETNLVISNKKVETLSEKSYSNSNSWKPDLNTIWTNFLEPIDRRIKKADESFSYIIKNDCKIRVENGIPIYYISKKKSGVIRFGKIFNPEFAHFVLGSNQIIRSIFNIIGAYDINIDIKDPDLPKVVSEIIKMQKDPVGILRLLGYIPFKNKKFLEFLREDLYTFSNINENIALGLYNLSEFLRKLFLEPDKDAKESIIGFSDSSGNGIPDSYDDLWIGITEADPKLKFKFGVIDRTIEDYPIKLNKEIPIGLLFEKEYIEDVIQLLNRVSSHFSGKDRRPINLSEFNAIVPTVFRGFNIFPSSISVDFANIFLSKTPFRRFLPVFGIYDPPGDNGRYTGEAHPIFLIEGEAGLTAKATDLIQEVSANDLTTYCYVCNPGDRFKIYQTMATFIQDDCVSYKGSVFKVPLLSVPLPVIYIYFQDPSFAGSLFVSTKGLPNCQDDRDSPYQDFSMGNQYSTNKAFASWQKDIMEKFSIFSAE